MATRVTLDFPVEFSSAFRTSASGAVAVVLPSELIIFIIDAALFHRVLVFAVAVDIVVIFFLLILTRPIARGRGGASRDNRILHS